MTSRRIAKERRERKRAREREDGENLNSLMCLLGEALELQQMRRRRLLAGNCLQRRRRSGGRGGGGRGGGGGGGGGGDGCGRQNRYWRKRRVLELRSLLQV